MIRARLQAQAVEGIAKAMLPFDTNVVPVRCVSTALTHFLVDEPFRTGIKMLESDGCRGLLRGEAGEETNEDKDRCFHVFLVQLDVRFSAGTGPTRQSGAPIRRAGR
jgi:hypothetical protein